MTEMQTYHETVRVGNKVKGTLTDRTIVGIVAKIESRPFGQDYLVRPKADGPGVWFTRDELTRV